MVCSVSLTHTHTLYRKKGEKKLFLDFSDSVSRKEEKKKQHTKLYVHIEREMTENESDVKMAECNGGRHDG